jgi:hypothetical protein
MISTWGTKLQISCLFKQALIHQEKTKLESLYTSFSFQLSNKNMVPSKALERGWTKTDLELMSKTSISISTEYDDHGRKNSLKLSWKKLTAIKGSVKKYKI